MQAVQWGDKEQAPLMDWRRRRRSKGTVDGLEDEEEQG